MTAPNNSLELGELKREIIDELTNSYYETYRYDRPNDTVEQLAAYSHSSATDDINELIATAIDTLQSSLPEQRPKSDITFSARGERTMYMTEYSGGYNQAIQEVHNTIQQFKESLTGKIAEK